MIDGRCSGQHVVQRRSGAKRRYSVGCGSSLTPSNAPARTIVRFCARPVVKADYGDTHGCVSLRPRVGGVQEEQEAHRKWVSASGPPPGLPLCPACRCDSFTILMNVGCSASTSFLLNERTIRDSTRGGAGECRQPPTN